MVHSFPVAKSRLFLCASHNTDPNWRWISNRLSNEYEWRFVDTVPKNALERKVSKPHVARYRAAAEAAWSAKTEPVDLVISHMPLISCYTALGCAALSVDAPHLAFAFNFTNLPQGTRHKLMQTAFAHIDRFVVPSTIERHLYSRHFEIPLDKIDLLRWGVQPPRIADDATPLIEGDYVCALGGEGRDYSTLVEAMRKLPQIRLVIVARPKNLVGLELPPNVSAFTDIALDDAWNIMRFSRMAALPLRDAEVPCGHVTLVAAMYLSKALVITASEGIADYVEDGVTGLTFPPGDPTALARAIEEVWEDRELAHRLGTAAERFARTHCSEDVTVRYFAQFLKQRSLSLQ